MNIKSILLGSLMIGGLLAVVRMLSTRSTIHKPSTGDDSLETIDVYLEKQMRRLHIPGAVMAIVEGNKIVHTRSFGLARPGGETPSMQTPFFIGSLTKSITAMAVMQLVEAGKVELDAPVQNYLPWFRTLDAQASKLITVRHLLNQTSGLPEKQGEQVLADFDDRHDANERQVRSLAKVKTIHPAGSKVEYCNLNYNILGLIIEAVSGELYEDYIQRHIFNPLGMCHSYTTKAEARKKGLAMGYRHWFSLPFPEPNLKIPRGSLPSGQLISSAEDMAHYLIAHLNGGRYGDVQVLSSAGIDELHRGNVEYVKMGISGGKYGMGWFEIDLGKTKTYSHTGNVPDFSAFMALIPEQKKGIVLLLNADPYGLPPILGEVGMGMTALLAGQQPAPIRLDFIQWIMRFLPLIPILQIVDFLTTLKRLSHWRQNPRNRPSTGQIWRHHILLPLIPNLSMAGLLAYFLITGMFGFIKLFMPDVSWITLISGSFAGVWTMLRTGLMLKSMRKSSQP